MQHSSLLFESSPWFIILCILVALLYTVTVYYKTKIPWGKTVNWILASTRFILVFILCFLLLGPLFRHIVNTIEKPTIVIAIDDSGSIGEIESQDRQKEIIQSVAQLKSELEAHNNFVDVRSFKGSLKADELDSLSFNQNQSDITQLLTSVENEFESRNLSRVILLSDGIYNQGINPVFKPFSFPLDIIGVGDTVQKPDLILNNLTYNKIAYQGNKFPLMVELFAIGFNGQNIELEIRNKGKLLETRNLVVTKPTQFFEEQFLIDAKEKGYQQYSVVLKNKENELSIFNNQKDAFVDVIEGKEKILIAAPYPHPDIKAIRAALEDNQNYEVTTYIEGIGKMPTENFDVYILHQVPNFRNTHATLLGKIKNEHLPVFYILGPLSNLNTFNAINSQVKIQLINNQSDEVFTYQNLAFTTFNLSDETDPTVRKYPPISVPFANFTLSPSADVLLYQKVGSIETNKPLLLIGSEGQKEGVLIGNGLWQWRLNEYSQKESTLILDELVTKTIQYLSAKDDRRKFKIYTLKNEFFDNEPVIFETEVYNDIYERVYGQEINLSIKNAEGYSSGYRYVTSQSNSRYIINNLLPGVYQFEGSASIDGKTETATGTFVIKKLQIEQTRLTADHQLLRTLASDNRGSLYSLENAHQIAESSSVLNAQNIIHSQEDFTNLINLKWVFYILLLLFSIEWFMRKYFGSY